MTTHRIVILGAGAAGSAAARALAGCDAVTTTLLDRTGRAPYNRTLVNKAVAVGLLTPQQAQLPAPDARLLADTAHAVDLGTRTVRAASGAVLGFDALLVTTGSAPRTLGDSAPGAAAAAAAGRLTSLHSLDDALRVREALARRPAPARVVVLGAGLIAAETSSLLHEQGHAVTLVARSALPGAGAFGHRIAARLADAHRAHVSTAFGRTPAAIRLVGEGLEVTWDDGTRLRADLAIAALGTTPVGPAPWRDGVRVDDHLRAPQPRCYAAGGVAVHRDRRLGTWRIDHWADAAAQGEHAARTILADLGLGTDPGPYLPRSLSTATVYGTTIAAVGLTGAHRPESVVATEPLIVVHESHGVTVGAAGVDAVPAVLQRAGQLYRPAAEGAAHPA